MTAAATGGGDAGPVLRDQQLKDLADRFLPHRLASRWRAAGESANLLVSTVGCLDGPRRAPGLHTSATGRNSRPAARATPAAAVRPGRPGWRPGARAAGRAWPRIRPPSGAS